MENLVCDKRFIVYNLVDKTSTNSVRLLVINKNLNKYEINQLQEKIHNGYIKIVHVLAVEKQLIFN